MGALTPAILLGLCAGCAGRGELRDWQWHGRETSYRVGPLPPGWERVRGEGDIAFRESRAGAAILANGLCSESVDAPLAVLRNNLLIGFTDREVREEREVTLDGRAALRSLVSAKLDGVPVRILSYVVKKDGCVYDLVYTAPERRWGEHLGDFERLVAGFQTVQR